MTQKMRAVILITLALLRGTQTSLHHCPGNSTEARLVLLRRRQRRFVLAFGDARAQQLVDLNHIDHSVDQLASLALCYGLGVVVVRAVAARAGIWLAERDGCIFVGAPIHLQRLRLPVNLCRFYLSLLLLSVVF